jgi:two-component sensor histidine kinase
MDYSLTDRLEILLDATADLNAMLSTPGALYNSLLERLSKAVNFYSGSIQILDQDICKVMALRGNLDPRIVMGLRFPMDPLFPNYQVVMTKVPVAFKDIRDEYPLFRTRAKEFGSAHIRSWLGVPMIVEDSVIGMIALDRDTIDPFAPDDIRIVQAFADNAAVAIRNARTFHELDEALLANNRMMRELNHRVKNSLQLVSSLISLYSDMQDVEASKSIFEDLSLRIESIAHVHEMLYKQADSYSSINLKSYLQSIMEDFRSAFLGLRSNISLDCEFEELKVEMSMAIPLGLMLNEILTNSIKYAFPSDYQGKIRISLHKDDDNASLLIEDNGIGIKAKVPSGTQKTGFGFEFIQSMAEQIDGTAILTSVPGHTSWIISFPL